MKASRSTTGSSTLLKSAIKRTIYLTLVVAGAASVLSPLASASDTGGTTDLPPVDVTPPVTPPPDEIPPPPLPPGGDGGGDGGGDEDGEHEAICQNLKATKPAMCPNPIPIPSGSTYAQDKLPGASINGKSTVMMAIAYSQNRAYGPNGAVSQVDPTAAWAMDFALNKQTENYANPGMSFKDATSTFRNDLKSVCELESMGSNKYRIAGQLTVPEYYCFEIMKALDVEADDQMSFIQFFLDWSKRYGVPLESYVPGPVVSSASMDNSLGVKWKVTSADAACSSWWTSFQQNQCSL
ncbi:hypothetical protein XTPLMG730_3782 [Xanthomonas translucens pv. phlei]|uniref:Secreted protein n=2 Tax=Xanthomonas translucens group TaxID=3390202 RepID=A0A0K3ACG0_9XANT|nr:hypothetical protein XTPLMG730_3782 [Xanthomonas translucens pv. phlei]